MLILVCILIAIPVCSREIPAAIGAWARIGLVKRTILPYLVVTVCMAGAVVLGDYTSRPLARSLGEPSAWALCVIGLSAAAVYTVAWQFSLKGSILYMVLGAVMGYRLAMQGALPANEVLPQVLPWVVAPLMACGIAFAVGKFTTALLSRSKSHIVYKNRAVYLLLGLSAIVLLFAIGANNGALLLDFIERGTLLLGSSAPADLFPARFAILLLILLSAALPLARRIGRHTEGYASGSFYMSPQPAMALTLGVAATMLLMSLPGFCSLIGLSATPLSASQAAFGALAGVQLSHGRLRYGAKEVALWLGVTALTAGVAMAVAWAACKTAGAQAMTAQILRPEGDPWRGATLSLALIALAMLIATVVYRSHQQKKQIARARISAEEQAEMLTVNKRSITDLEVKAMRIQNDNLNQRLELQRNELINVALNITQQKEFLDFIHNRIKSLRDEQDPGQMGKGLSELEKTVASRMHFSQEMEGFYARVELLHKDFNVRLKSKFPDLTESDTRLMTLLRLGFSSKHIASMMNLSPKSVEIGRYRLRGKLELDRNVNLIQFIKNI